MFRFVSVLYMSGIKFCLEIRWVWLILFSVSEHAVSAKQADHTTVFG
jgi:hypothetical protein